MSKNEAAFPQSGFQQWEPMPGMTLRDYFAAKALAAMINQPGKEPVNCGLNAVHRLALFSYEYADAMLATREPSK